MTTFYLDPEGGDDLGSDFSLYGRVPAHNAIASVAVGKYGGRSISTAAGTSSYMSFPNQVANGMQVGAFKFTAEAWVYFTSHSATTVEPIMGQWNSTLASSRVWQIGMNASGQLQYQWSTSGTAAAGTLTAAWTPTLNQWYHIAFDRDGTTARLYVDGAVVASVADALPALFVAVTNMYVGGEASNQRNFPGYIQDARLTKGVARYAGAFTPPTGPLPTSYKDDPWWHHVYLLVPCRMDGTGTSYAQRWRTIESGASAARTAPGDTIRLRATPDPTLVGNATWTQNGKTVTLASAVNATIENCDNAWTASANVTATANTSTARREGSAFVNLAVAAAFTTGKIAYQPIPEVSTGSATIANRTSNLLGAGTLTLLQNANADDAFIAITLPFNVSVGGYTTNKVFVCSNNFVTFLAAPSTTLYSPTASNPTAPNIQMGVKDCSYQRVYAGSEDGNATYRIRYEGHTNNSGTVGSPTVVWELTFSAASPKQLKIDFGVNGNSALTTKGVSDGTQYLTTFPSGVADTGYTVDFPASTPMDLSAYQQVSFWFQTNNSINSGVLRLCLCSDATGDTVIRSFYLPDFYSASSRWHALVFDLGAALPSSVASVALYADADPGAITFMLDNIVACKASSSADALTHRSLIGKVHNLSWAATTAYSVGDRRRPTQLNRNGFLYQVTGSLAGTAHRYWRINISANNGSFGATTIIEFEMHTAIGGANVVSGGTALASSDYGSTFAGSQAFDGNTSTYWSATGPVATLQYDYGAGNAKNIVEVAIRSYPGGESPATSPKNFTIQYSDDGSTWTTVYTATNQTSWGLGELRTFSFPPAATSGTTEPAWPAVWGKTVTDGTVVWTCIANELEDSWFGITGINGTTLTLDNSPADVFTSLRGYHGATETVATYKRETANSWPYPINFNTSNSVRESGSAGVPITYSGGWDRTDMSVLNAETWWDGVNGNGNGLNIGSFKFINVDHFNAVRFGSAIAGSTGGAGTISNCHGNNCTSGFDLSGTQGLWTLYGVHGFNNAQYGVGCPNNATMFGKAIQGSNNGASGSGPIGVQLAKYKTRINNVVARNNGGTGIGSYSNNVYDAIVYNYATSGNFQAVSSGQTDYNSICFVNGTSSEATFVTQSGMGGGYSDAMLFSHKHGGDATDHRVYFAEGTIRSDTAIRHTASGLAWKCSLTSNARASNYPVRFSLGRYVLQANVPKTFKVWSRRDVTTMKGALLIYGGSLAGIDADATVSTDPSTVNTWEQSAGLTVTPLETGVVELWMLWWDGVGTNSNYWIDDLTVT